MFCPINAQEMCVPTKQKGKHNAKIKPKGPNLKLLHQLHFGEHFSWPMSEKWHHRDLTYSKLMIDTFWKINLKIVQVQAHWFNFWAHLTGICDSRRKVSWKRWTTSYQYLPVKHNDNIGRLCKTMQGRHLPWVSSIWGGWSWSPGTMVSFVLSKCTMTAQILYVCGCGHVLACVQACANECPQVSSKVCQRNYHTDPIILNGNGTKKWNRSSSKLWFCLGRYSIWPRKGSSCTFIPLRSNQQNGL